MTQDELSSFLNKDNGADIYTKLQFLIQQLKDKSLDHELKVMYLKLLIHLVGDAHQPMHVSRAEDSGGNKVGLFWFGDSTNLHAVWDDKLIDFQKLSYTEYANAINYPSARDIQSWQQSSTKEWLFESYDISQNLYTELKYPNQKLSYRYNFDHINILNQQLLKAGVRLAGTLNAVLSE